MRVVFLGRLSKDAIAERIKKVPGVDLFVADTVPQLVEELAGADALITPDFLGDEARQIVEALRKPGKTVRWLQFVSAGQEGLTAAGLLDLSESPLPSRVELSRLPWPSMRWQCFWPWRGGSTRAAPIRRSCLGSSITLKTTALEGRVLAIIGSGQCRSSDRTPCPCLRDADPGCYCADPIPTRLPMRSTR